MKAPFVPVPAAKVLVALIGSLLPYSPVAAQTKLSDTQAAGSGVTNFLLSADGSRVVYIGILTSDGVAEIYSASTAAAGTQIKLNNTPVANGDVSSQFLVEGDRAVYQGNLDNNNAIESYSASILAPGNQIPLNLRPLISGGNVVAIADAASGTAILRGDLTTNGINELYAVSVSSTASEVKVSSTPVAGGAVEGSDLYLTPDGTRAIYKGDLVTDNVRELFSASTFTPGTQVKLNDTPVAGGFVDQVELTPDGTLVVYTGDLLTDEVREVFSAASTDPDTQIRISNPPVTGGGLIGAIKISPDGARVVYDGDFTTDNVRELYSASTTVSGTQIKISETVVGAGFLAEFKFPATGDRVVYRGSLDSNAVFELYSASTTAAGTQVKLNDTPVAGGDVQFFQPTPDGSRVVYVGDLDLDFQEELYSASTTAAGTQVRLSDIPGFSAVSVAIVTPDSKSVVFPASVDGKESLWWADLRGLFAPVRLTPVTPHGSSILSNRVLITPDSRKAVFAADLETDNVFEVYSVDLPSATVPGPTLTLRGPKRIRTTASRVAVRGTASSLEGIRRVDFTATGARPGQATGTESWQFFARLKKPRTTLQIRATANDGQISTPLKVVVLKKP